MLISLINKALLMVLTMACLNLIRHSYYFIQAWLKSDEETPEKYKVSNKSLWVLSISIGYIISSIFYGVFI
jgi:amino acid transporter